MTMSLVVAVTGLIWQTYVPLSLLVIPILLGGLLLRFRQLAALTVTTLAVGAYVVMSR